MRTLDATVANSIVNGNPVIAASVLHDPANGPFDIQAEVDCVLSCILMDNGRDAAALFHESSPFVWQAHSIFGTTCRGRAAIETGKAFVREMFEVWGAEELWGSTPISNRAAHWFNRQIGAEYVRTSVHHTTGECLDFRIKRDAWLARFPSQNASTMV